MFEIPTDMQTLNDFKVAIVAAGKGGPELIARATDPYDLVVPDISMPGMSGAKVYDDLTRM